MQNEFYDLFGYGGLNPEIVEYLMALLTTNTESKDKNNSQKLQSNLLVNLFKRLEEFYNKWSKGEFINSLQSFPSTKSQEMRDYKHFLGQREIDIYAGLNVIILLQKLQRYAKSQTQDPELKEKINFYLCGKPNTERELVDPTLISRLIGYSNCIGADGFTKTVGSFLSGANLSDANLSDANLSGTNLSGANLSGTNLSGANLYGTNLSGANLSGANLYGANLYGANLSRADLYGANLFGANLSRADLYGANLSGANLSRADLYGANLFGANLDNANLYDANLDNANLDNANLSRAIELNCRQVKEAENWEKAKYSEEFGLILEKLSQSAN